MSSNNYIDDEFETHQSQRKLALNTVDELMDTKLYLMDLDKNVPRFINNAISYLKKKYVTEEKVISDYLLKQR